jgi:hypothetical protein
MQTYKIYIADHRSRFNTLCTSLNADNFFLSKWLKEVNYMLKLVIWAGALAVISPLYLCRNDKVFNDNFFYLM